MRRWEALSVSLLGSGAASRVRAWPSWFQSCRFSGHGFALQTGTAGTVLPCVAALPEAHMQEPSVPEPPFVVVDKEYRINLAARLAVMRFSTTSAASQLQDSLITALDCSD